MVYKWQHLVAIFYDYFVQIRGRPLGLPPPRFATGNGFKYLGGNFDTKSIF